MSSPEAKGEQLGQLRPADTNAASIYSPDSEEVNTAISLIVICETSGTARTFRIFHDEDGTTYDQTTALYYDVPIGANQTVELYYEEGSSIWMKNVLSNIAVRSSFASALTFTVYGKEHITQ